MARGSSKAKRLTDSPAYDHSPGLVARRQEADLPVRPRRPRGHLADRIGRAGQRCQLAKANSFKVTQLTKTEDAEQGISFSPDGKRISFMRSGKLLTMNARRQRRQNDRQ